MKRLLSLITIALFAVSCKKDQHNNSELNGTWVSQPYEWQLPIKNVTGDGEIIRFLESSEHDGRLLTMFMEDSTYRFKVLSVKQKEMDLLYLKDNRAIHFIKIDYPKSGF